MVDAVRLNALARGDPWEAFIAGVFFLVGEVYFLFGEKLGAFGFN